MTTKKSRRLTLQDRLSRLNYEQACRLLGPEGRRWIQEGGSWPIDIDEQVRLRGGRFRLTLPDAEVCIRLDAALDRLHHYQCRIRQDLSTGAPGHRARRVVLLLS